jgi:acyl carrier protein phosphodiesterase
LNYLAHTSLSGSKPRIMLGNLFGDFAKGGSYSSLHPEIQIGIKLHRSIDSFTDKHKLHKESSAIFQPLMRRYAPIAADVAYDHFLSANWPMFSNKPLAAHIGWVLGQAGIYRNMLPARAQIMLPSLKANRYLQAYASMYGLARVFSRMSLRSSLPDISLQVTSLIRSNYSELNAQFLEFYAQLHNFAETERHALCRQNGIQPTCPAAQQQ